MHREAVRPKARKCLIMANLWICITVIWQAAHVVIGGALALTFSMTDAAMARDRFAFPMVLVAP